MSYSAMSTRRALQRRGDESAGAIRTMWKSWHWLLTPGYHFGRTITILKMWESNGTQPRSSSQDWAAAVSKTQGWLVLLSTLIRKYSDVILAGHVVFPNR